MDFNKAIENRNFQGVFIPADLYLNTNLTWTEKILIIEINSLDKEIEGVRQGCFASNEYLAAFLDKEANSLANMITDLRSRGIVIERKKFDGRRRYIGIDFEAIKAEPKRIKAVKLKKEQKQQGSQKSKGFEDSQNNEGSLHKKVNPAFTKKCEQLSQKNEHINTNIKTDINTVDKGEYAEQSSTLFPEKNTSIENVFEEVEEKKPTAKTNCEKPANEAKYFFEVSHILQEFEALMSVKFKIPETKKLFERYGQANKIIKVLQEGHSLELCLEIIRMKHKEWFNDSKMRIHIEPVTIFAPHNFNKYITQLQISKNNPQNGKQSPQTIPASDQAQRDKLALLKTKCHNKRIDFSSITGDIPAQIIQLEKLLA
jgi:hypothetical protein